MKNIINIKLLYNWYNPAKRDLPWKKTNDAYLIWLSEIILQQTRVEQGKPYYLKFISKYPTVIDFANANLDDILKLWEGLGYYSRARNLHFTANIIKEKYNGIFPSKYEDILALKGIGKYTAAAISSFAFQLPYAVLDGNVFRFLARYFGVEIPTDSTIGKKYFEQLAQDNLDLKNPAKYNQAIMDFGALVCKPQNPTCNICPFSSNCFAFNNNKIAVLPIKHKKIIKKERWLHFFIIKNKNSIFIEQRNEKDIWKKLWQFPLIETFELTNFKLLPHSKLKQILTHQTIYANFYIIDITEIKKIELYFNVSLDITNFKKINKIDLELFAFPKIINTFLEDYFLQL